MTRCLSVLFIVVLAASFGCKVSSVVPVDGTPGDDGSASRIDASVANADARPPLPDTWCQTGDAILAQTVSGMTAGTWSELPSNPSLDAIEMHYTLTSWADTGVYNPVAGSIQWVGGPGSCCADPSAFELLTYHVADDTWTLQETPWDDHSGHAYDGNAVDPGNGTFYFAKAGDVRGFDGTTWTPLPTLPYSAPIASAATWFRELSGTGALLHVGGGTSAAWYDGAQWHELDAPGAGWGGYHVFAEHNPVHGVAWLGAGVDASQQHYRLDSSLSLQEMSSAPIALDADGRARKTYDPISGDFIVYRPEDSVWYEYDVVQDLWTNITTTMEASLPATWNAGAYGYFVPVDDCGVIFAFNHAHDDRRAYVYKHSD